MVRFAAGDLVRAEPGGWAREVAPDGLVVLVADEGCVLIRHGEVWRRLGERLGEVQGLARLGLNTEADAANPLAARLARALFTAPGGADGGDLRLVLNKDGASDVGSLLFQSGWQGRAEIGLVGDDDLVLKVADDAGIWREALRVDRGTAGAVFAAGAGRLETVLLTEDGVWTPPAWARRVEVRVTGGGGGGASGAYGPAGVRPGGGGGGAGGMATAVWDAAELTGGLAAEIGQGGAGGVADEPDGSDGADGGQTRLLVDGMTRIRVLGGGGGKADGEGGAGGLGQIPANGGGEGGAEGSAEAGAERECAEGPGGGAGGGGLTAGGEAGAGAGGGAGASVGAAVIGGAGGVLASGSDGAAADDLWPWAGGGGGGGGAVGSGVGHDGGDGGSGAGGGGGGAGVAGAGTGGRGGDGCVILTVVG
ncbi:hypothetical protein ACO2Q1_04105 [Brevundimonas sp. VNH65]|uniref:glycine-rich domain-containing protein n=1 Tax=Brevundimonas sp. VNH65 TaxID=3400917 RepID=UPI003C00EA90